MFVSLVINRRDPLKETKHHARARLNNSTDKLQQVEVLSSVDVQKADTELVVLDNSEAEDIIFVDG